MRKAHKLSADTALADFFGTPDRDTFIVHAGDGLKTVADFDVTQDRLMVDVDGGYSDLFLDDVHDGSVLQLFTGGRIEIHAADANHDGITDTAVDAYGAEGEVHVVLLSVDPDSLHGWNLAGG